MKLKTKILIGVFVFVIFFISSFNVKAKEITINDIVEKYNENIKPSDDMKTGIIFKAELKPAIGCSTDECVDVGRIDILRNSEPFFSFLYDKTEKTIEYDEKDEEKIEEKNLLLFELISSIGEIYGYTETEIGNLDSDIIDNNMTFESKSIEYYKSETNNIIYMKINYGDEITDFFDEYIKISTPEVDPPETTVSTTTEEYNKDKDYNPKTSIGKDTFITIMLISLIIVIYVLKLRIKKLNKKNI